MESEVSRPEGCPLIPESISLKILERRAVLSLSHKIYICDLSMVNLFEKKYFSRLENMNYQYNCDGDFTKQSG
jgi:hypothetical protein